MAPLRVIVRGGSIGGLFTAHSLIKAGCDVTIFEQAPVIAAAGAGLGLDARTGEVMESMGLTEQYEQSSLPMPIEIDHSVRGRQLSVFIRDAHMNYRSTHWGIIHGMLLKALPKQGEGIVHYAHTVTGLSQPDGQQQVKVKVHKQAKKEGGEGEDFETTADLVVAADGSQSQTRAQYVPNESRRYVGYCAWRGLLKGKEKPEVAQRFRETYKDMGRALYFDIAKDTHAVAYELPGEQLNWLWYVNQPEPELKGGSLTVQASDEQIQDMKRSAQDVWHPALAELMQETEAPFMNALFDREPLKTFVYGRVVLMGEAAHPTSPHGLRSTSMAIADAASLGKAIEEHAGDLDAALKHYDQSRVPATTREVLFSRYLGQVKQGWMHNGNNHAWQDGADSDRWKQQLPQQRRHSFDPSKVDFVNIKERQSSS